MTIEGTASCENLSGSFFSPKRNRGSLPFIFFSVLISFFSEALSLSSAPVLKARLMPESFDFRARKEITSFFFSSGRAKHSSVFNT